MIRRILFVCLGNICRSPTAEAVFRKMADRDDLLIDSAGTSGWHIGNRPDARAIAAAARAGYDLTDLSARQVVAADFGRFDLIVAMDGNNRDTLRQMAPAAKHDKIRLLLDFAADLPDTDVPDPYYDDSFDETLALIEAGCRGLVTAISPI